jgi:hypothetical protein
MTVIKCFGTAGSIPAPAIGRKFRPKLYLIPTLSYYSNDPLKIF